MVINALDRRMIPITKMTKIIDEAMISFFFFFLNPKTTSAKPITNPTAM